MAGTLVTLDPRRLAGLHSPLLVLPATVHVWAFSLQTSPESALWYRQWLSDAEQARADRFVFEKDRNAFLVAHGVLRHLLGRYCRMAPESLRFGENAAGKPYLQADSMSDHPVSFNLTHSHGHALLAVSDGREIGLDLEKIRPEVEAMSIARNYFFGLELRAIENAAAEMRRREFFRYWVAKEAVLKAQGVGLGFPLDQFHVEFLPNGESARVQTLNPSRLFGDWVVRMLDCEEGWMGAVAAAGREWKVQVERLS